MANEARGRRDRQRERAGRRGLLLRIGFRGGAHQLAPEDGGRPAEVFGEAWVEVRPQPGEEEMAHLVAGDGKVGVGGVFAPGDAAPREKGAQVGVAQVEKGADEGEGADMGDALEAGEAVRTRTAREAEEEGLGHIVGVVARGDGVEPEALRHAREEREAYAAGRHFKRLARLADNVRAGCMEGESEVRREAFHEPGVGGGVRTEPVVDVQDDGIEVERRAEVGHQDEKGGGVGAAGDGEADAAVEGRRRRGAVGHGEIVADSHDGVNADSPPGGACAIIRGMCTKSRDCTVLVASCDAYADVVGPFATLKQKYWPDCPFETVLVTETLPAAGFDRVVLTGKGKCWCEMLVEALDRIATPYVLLMMDDYYLVRPVDTAQFLRRLEQAKAFDAANLRLNPNPPGRMPFGSGEDRLFAFPKNVAYCVTCQAGIWNRGYLRGLAVRNRSAWEFERLGSFMLAGETRPLLVTPTREFPFVDAVHKGYWEPWGVRALKENGIAYDFSKRSTPPLGIRMREAAKALVFALFPWTLIVRIQNALGVGMKEKPKGGGRDGH
mgnify:CR=1 FL=1